MDALTALSTVLKASVDKNGSQPLTTEYLLNIVSMADRLIESEEESFSNQMQERLNLVLGNGQS